MCSRKPVIEEYSPGRIKLLAQAYACGKTMDEIAQEEGVSKSTISRLIGNRRGGIPVVANRKRIKKVNSNIWWLVGA